MCVYTDLKKKREIERERETDRQRQREIKYHTHTQTLEKGGKRSFVCGSEFLVMNNSGVIIIEIYL